LVEGYLLEHSELRDRYEFYLREVERQRGHVLSAREEELLGKFSVLFSLPERIREALHDADMKFPKGGKAYGEYEVHHGVIDELLQNRDPHQRAEAFSLYWSEYGKYAQTFAAT